VVVVAGPREGDHHEATYAALDSLPVSPSCVIAHDGDGVAESARRWAEARSVACLVAQTCCRGGIAEGVRRRNVAVLSMFPSLVLVLPGESPDTDDLVVRANARRVPVRRAQ
jgi:hypothetical protein